MSCAYPSLLPVTLPEYETVALYFPAFEKIWMARWSSLALFD